MQYPKIIPQHESVNGSYGDNIYKFPSFTVKMTSAQVVKTLVKVTPNSPSQNYTHPNDHTLHTYDTAPGLKPFTAVMFV